MDSLTVQRLTLAYMRRRKAENEALALEVIGRLVGATGGNAESTPPPRREVAKIPASEMLAMMHFEV